MKNLIFKILSLIVAAAAVTACSDEPDPPATPRAVLVYMVANNSLGSAGFDTADLNEMTTAARQGDFGKSRLLVYHHGRNTDPELVEITPEGAVTITTYDTSQSSVSSSRMRQVIDDFKHEANALNYGLILWSHGSGWIENGMESRASDASSAAVTPLSFGDDGGRYMNVSTLADVLSGKGFDYIYFDCCYMAGVEVVYELRHCADRIVASSTELPAQGMPYYETLRHLLKADADLTAAARSTFDFYNSQTGMYRTCSISVINTEGLDLLAKATRAVYRANNITSPGFAPQQFMTSSCYLFDFGQYVDDLSADMPDLKAGFDDALDNVIIFKASTPMLWEMMELTHHSGLSTFLPDFADTNRFSYDNLQWATDVASALSR